MKLLLLNYLRSVSVVVNRKKFNCTYVCKIERDYIINYTGVILKHNTQSILIPYEDLSKLQTKINTKVTPENILKSLGLSGVKLTQNQQNNLMEIYHTRRMNREFLPINLLKILMARDVPNILKRIRLLNNINGSAALPYLILQFGLSEGICRYNNSLFKVNNPGFNHQGLYSANSKKFIKYKGLDENEIKNKINDVRMKSRQTKQKHPENENARYEYYVKLYGDNDIAKQKYYERCNTRSLNMFIHRYGLEEGTKRFNNTVQKWLTTLNNKPIEEKIRINRAKASKIDSKYKPGGELHNTKGLCYYIKFFDDNITFYKIGITKKSVDGRFGKFFIKGMQYIIIDIYEDLIYECFKKEQNILKSFDNNRINIIRNNILFTTEAFDTDVLKGDKIENY